MNTVTTIVIGIIILAIITKNWNKIRPVIDKMKTDKIENTIELSKTDVETLRNRKLIHLINKRTEKEQKLKELTQPLEQQIKNIDAEIYLMRNQR